MIFDLPKFLEENTNRHWNLKNLVVALDDEIIMEHYSTDIDALLPQYSITKAFTTAVIGILSDQSKLSVEDNIIDYLELPYIDKKMEQVKIKHLLMNAMGNAKGYLFEADRHNINTDDYLLYIAAKPLKYKAGEKFVYSNSNYYLLSRIVENVTNEALDDYMAKVIFEPLGIKQYRASRCPMNHFLGASGLFMNTSDMLKLGIMYASKGLYENKRLLSKDYIEQCISYQIKLNGNERYGYSFMMKDARYAFVTGKANQLLLIDRKRPMVIAINSSAEPSQSATLMKVVRDCIKS